MAQTNILCPVTVPDFVLTQDDPMYNTELANWLIAKNIENMAEAGLQWSDGVPDDLESAWKIQDELLSDLEDQFYSIGDLLSEKIAALPSESTLSSLFSSFVEGGLELFGGWLLSKISITGGPLTAILLPLTTTALSFLLSTYATGQSKANTFTGMIIDLLAMTPSSDGYLQRASQISTFTSAASTILDEIVQVEQENLINANAMLPIVDALNKLNANFRITYDESIHEGLEPIEEESEEGEVMQKISLLQLLAEWQKVQALSEKIVQCPTTGRYIYTKSIPERSEEA